MSNEKNNYTQYNEESKNNSDIELSTGPEQFFNDMSALPSEVLQVIDHHINGFITVWDYQGNIVYCSKTIEKLLGYKITELLGMKWKGKVVFEDLSYIKDYFKVNDSDSQSFTVTVQDRDGKTIWTESHVSQIECAKGAIYYLASTQDITDKKETEEMMVRSEKMSIAGQLAAGIVHEIRNPLTSLKGFLQLLQAGVNRRDEFYQIMIEEIEKMEGITSELLFISKPLTNIQEKENLRLLIDDVVTLFNSQAKLKNIEIVWVAKKNYYIYCDRTQIKQVLINILKNAIEATHENGQIEVSIYDSADEVWVDICDQGEGVPEEVLHKIGEPFFTTKENGTGLGLLITKQILQRHNGEMKVLNNRNGGSVFRIILPGKRTA